MKHPKRKGCAGEREAASFLREHGFANARRGQQFCGGPDSPDVTGVPGWHLEVKRVERLNLRDAAAQAAGDCGGKPWCILHRWNHGPWLATVRAEDWLALVRETLPPSAPERRPPARPGDQQTPLAPAPAPCGVDPAPEPEQEQDTKGNDRMKTSDMYPSRWLKAADVARPALATIRNVTIEEVVEGEQKPVLHFAGTLKPMVLNRTNTASIAELYGEDTDGWNGKAVVLYSAKVQFQSKLVDAIRIRAPRLAAPAPAPAPAPSPTTSATSAPDPASEDTDDVPY